MKKTLLVQILLLSTLSFGQKKQDDSFVYNTLSHIGEKTAYVGFELAPLIISTGGNDIKLGAGAAIRANNLVEKFSLEGKFDFNYFEYSTNRNHIGYRSTDGAAKKNYSIDANFGYTFLQKRKDEEYSVRLKKTGNTVYIAYLPTITITSYSARVGFYYNTFYQKGEIKTDELINFAPLKPYYLIHEQASDIYIGAVRRISHNSTYQTDKYGVVKSNGDSEIYVDLIFNLKNNFPQIFRLQFENQFRPNEITGEATVSHSDQNEFRDQFFKVPVGIRGGYRLNDFKMSSFGWYLEGGVYPGSYSSIGKIFNVKMGLTYSFHKFLN